MLTAALAAALALGSLATACSSSDTPATVPSSTSAATSTRADDGATPPGGTAERPKLLDAGDAPRQRLRLAYETGSKGAAKSTSTVKVTVGSKGQQRTMAPEPTTSTMAWEVIKADDTGAQVQTTITHAPSAPSLVGITVNVRVSSRGAPDTVTLAGDDELDATTRSLVRSLVGAQQAFGAVLPVEPVGVGASWQIAGTTEISGVRMQSVTTYHLDAVDGSKVTYHADLALSASDQDLELPGAGPGGGSATGHLVSADISGTEEGTMDLEHPGGTSTSKVSGTEELTMEGPDGKVGASEAISLETEIRPISP